VASRAHLCWSPPRWVLAACLFGRLAAPAAAQTVTNAGYVDVNFRVYPQSAPNDDTHAILTAVAHWDPLVKWTSWQVNASFEGRGDTHDMTTWAATYWDRTTPRPAFAVRRLSASWVKGKLTLEFGKQFIRWGKTDIVIPTERFAPKDYLEVVRPEPFGVTAARVNVSSSSDSLEIVFTPRMTPARIPLFDQRWVVAPAAAQGLPLEDAGADFPAGVQGGARWNHLGRRLEHSLSFFSGYAYLPNFLTAVAPAPTPHIDVSRQYPQLTSVGGDAAVPLPWFTVKGEAAWFGSSTSGTEEYVLYVIQLERQVGEWLFIGGYAGEHVTTPGTLPRFAPDRGLARAIVGRASYTIDTNRSLTFESVIRQNGDGFMGAAEYAHAFGKHQRVTAAGRLIRGEPDDFLGQYRLNSSASITWRYSF
jgi:hypothetical protein